MMLAKEQGWLAETWRSWLGSAEGMEAPERESSVSEKAKVREGEAGIVGKMGLRLGRRSIDGFQKDR